MQHLKIAEAAERLGISPRTIRFYEAKGLLAPDKSPGNGYRQYTEQDLLRLQAVISLREAGLSLAELANVLETYGMEESEELLYLLELHRSLLYAKRLDLDAQIRMNEELIGTIRADREASPEKLFAQAENFRRARELRGGWEDHYRFDLIAESFDETVGSNKDYPGYEGSLKRLIDELDPQPGETGLDLGAGTGNLAGTIQKRGAAMKALDQSRRMLRICRQKHPLLETRLGNLLAVPFYDGTFDFVVSSYVLHLFTPEERLLALGEMMRVLKPRGRLGLVSPMPEEEWTPLREELKARKCMTALHRIPGGDGTAAQLLIGLPLYEYRY